MVSRFPNGSPINLYELSERTLIASFNKDITPADLIGKLVAICCTDDGYVCNATAQYERDVLVLQDDTIGLISLIIEGNNLYVSPDRDVCYIFDIDFDQQHKKIFEATDGGYLLVMPQLTPGGTPKEMYVITTIIDAREEDQELDVELQINNQDEEQGYQPIGNNIDLDDQDVCSWFDNGMGLTHFFDCICTLVEKILKMEYDLEGITVEVSSRYSSVPDIDGGTLNLFTDGSPAPRPQPVVPLQMVSRFISGSPIIIPENDNERHLLCTFNRDITIDDLNNKLKAVVCNIEGEGVDIDTAVVGTSVLGEKFCHLNGDTIFTLEVEGRNVYVKHNDAGYIFDVDYNDAKKRTFAKTDGVYQLVMPKTLDDNNNVEVFPFVRTAVTANELDIDFITANSAIVANDINLSEQVEGTIIGSISLQAMQEITTKIIQLEYNNSIVNVGTYDDENPIVPDGTLNLLTD